MVMGEGIVARVRDNTALKAERIIAGLFPGVMRENLQLRQQKRTARLKREEMAMELFTANTKN